MQIIRWTYAVVLLLLTACERDINLPVEEQPAKLVVEAQIETGSEPTVILTRTTGYFQTLSLAQLANSFERNATVTLSDGQRTYTLKENAYPVGGGAFFYTYQPLPADNLRGKNNTTYTLHITLQNGQRYTSVAVIPEPLKSVDSLWWRKSPLQADTGTKVDVLGRFTDPPGLGNYIRVFIKVNSEQLLPPFNSVFDDQFVDGTQYNFQFGRGYDKTAIRDPNDDIDRSIRRGDTVLLKYCNIDKGVYDFWRTWEYNYSVLGSPFSSPIRVLGNVNNDALGAFSAYSVQYRRLIVPK